MRIVTDQDILAVDHSFSQWGELIKIPGRSINNLELEQADALLVRSITPVNEKLLQDTQVKFVASATAGTDHIDLPYLKQNNVGFAHAPGANANAVVDYCFAALAKIAVTKKLKLQQLLNREFAIIGAGNVGGLLHSKLRALGVSCRVHDPILRQQKSNLDHNFCSLEQALSADVITLHVPLTEQQPHPTRNMINKSNLSLLPNNAILINTCRGGVIEENALKLLLDQRQDISTIVDVWCNEPNPDPGLIKKIDIATPHIAGYSLDAKNAATVMIATAFANYFDLPAVPGFEDHSEQRAHGTLGLPVTPTSTSSVFDILLSAFAVDHLSSVFKTLSERGIVRENFDVLRQEIALRREFSAFHSENQLLDKMELAFLAELGMK